MNRREFLAAGMSTLATTVMAAPRPSFTFGFSLYGMRSLPLREALAMCAKIGYEAVELAALPEWPGDPAKLTPEMRQSVRGWLADHGLKLPALMENWPLDGDAPKQHERFKQVAELAHDLVPTAPPLIETILGGKPDQWDKVKDTFAERLQTWAKLAAAAKVTIAIKAHRFGAVNRPEQLRWLLDLVKSPQLAAVYDWSHFEQRDLTMLDTVKALAPVTKFVHVKDTVLDQGQAKFVLPGQGKTDYPALFAALADQQFQGCICVEVSGMVSGAKGYDPHKAATASYDSLAPALKKIRGKTPTP